MNHFPFIFYTMVLLCALHQGTALAQQAQQAQQKDLNTVIQTQQLMPKIIKRNDDLVLNYLKIIKLMPKPILNSWTTINYNYSINNFIIEQTQRFDDRKFNNLSVLITHKTLTFDQFVDSLQTKSTLCKQPISPIEANPKDYFSKRVSLFYLDCLKMDNINKQSKDTTKFLFNQVNVFGVFELNNGLVLNLQFSKLQEPIAPNEWKSMREIFYYWPQYLQSFNSTDYLVHIDEILDPKNK